MGLFLLSLTPAGGSELPPNEIKIKSDPNWSWEKIVQKQVEKGLTGDDIYKEIIASSQRSRDAVNKSLGVK